VAPVAVSGADAIRQMWSNVPAEEIPPRAVSSVGGDGNVRAIADDSTWLMIEGVTLRCRLEPPDLIRADAWRDGTHLGSVAASDEQLAAAELAKRLSHLN
jgi:hypothetical protein